MIENCTDELAILATMNSINTSITMTSPNSTTASVPRTDQETSHGVVLSTRPITSVSQRIGMNSSKTADQDSIQEIPWTLTSMLERFSFKASYAWTASQAPHTVIASLSVPSDLVVNSITSTPFEVFNYWRGDVEVRFQVTGTPFHQGMLAAVFIPLSTEQQSDSIVNTNFSSMSVNPTSYLFPNANSNAVMSIPFNHPSQYLDLTIPTDFLGRIYIVVFNRLRLAAGASDTVTVSLFSRFLQSEFKVPRLSGSMILAAPQSKDLVKSKVSHVAGGMLSKMMDKVLPHNVISDTLLPMMTSLFDKPTDPNQDAVVPQLTNRMNFRSGVDHIDKLVTEPTQIFDSNNLTFGTDNDEMSLAYLKTRYSYLGTFTVTTENAIGDVVASVPLNPLPNPIALNALNQVPLLSYLSIPFSFWRGSLTFKIQIVATSLQTLKLFAAFNFNTFTTPGALPLNEATSQYGEAFEINQGTNEIEFTVPYVSTTPYKYVPTGNVYTANDTLGYLNIVVLNRLVAPSNTPNLIEANVFVAGGNDFELSTLSGTNNFLPAVPQSSDITPPLESTMANVDQAEEKLVAPPSARVGRTPFTQVMMDSLQDYLKKYQPIRLIPLSSGTDFSLFIFSLEDVFRYTPQSALTFPNPASRPSSAISYNGLFSHFSSIFRQMRGGLRFKLANVLPASVTGLLDVLEVFFVPPTLSPLTATEVRTLFSSTIPVADGQLNPAIDYPAFIQNATRLPLHVFGGATNRVAEFELPFSSIYQSFLIGANALGGTDARAMGHIVIYAPPNSAQNLAAYVSLSDEARFGNLFCVPKVVPQVQAISGAFAPLPGESYSLNPPPTNTLTIL